MARTGRCACGAVTARINGEPAVVRQCWCRQCQQAASGGPTHNAMFNTADVDLTGDLASHDYVAASGNTLTHFFCGKCGTHVYARSSGRPQFRTVRLGFLDPDHGLKPQMAIWLDDAPDWAQIDPALLHFAQQPSAPAPKD